MNDKKDKKRRRRVGNKLIKETFYRDKATPLRCSFCLRDREEAVKLIAGPTLYICYECATNCLHIVEEQVDKGELRLLGINENKKCSFCEGRNAGINAMVDGREACICNVCLTLCKEIMAEDLKGDSR